MKHSRIAKQMVLALMCLFAIHISQTSLAQSASAKKHILIDIAHGEKFWNDPSKMAGMDPAFIERVKYMTTEITKSASSVNADIGYVSGKIKLTDLASCNLLFIHIPSTKFDADEAKAISQYVQNGGALFLVMDANYWSTLEQTNANSIISPAGLTFGSDSPDTLSGGHTKPGVINSKKLKVTYHGARIITGGTPFAFNDQSEQVFGTFTKSGKGKIIAMGDGMVSLYMTEWKDVRDYQCSEFMHDAFAWLLSSK